MQTAGSRFGTECGRLRGVTLASRDLEHETTKRSEVVSLDSKNMIEDKKNILRSATVPDHRAVGISRSELLLLLDGFHERLDAFFEEIRTLPQTTARLKAGNRRSAASE